ncbi:MFS transporter [Streptomyces sp. NPDC003032]
MRTQAAGPRRWWGLVGIALGVSMTIVDITIVNVITPSVIDDLGTDSSQAQWIQESHAIVFAALLLMFGRLADLLGARRVFVVGCVLFGATSLLAGLAPGGGVLILARFLQGAASAMLLPTSLSLLNQIFTGKARGQAFAVWGSTIGATTAVGPVIGGWLSEHASWRWAFGINVPLVVVILTLTLVCIPASPRRSGRVDVPGAVLSALGLAAMAFALVEGRTYGWVISIKSFRLFGATWNGGPSPAFVALVVAVVLLAWFVWRQVRLSRAEGGAEGLEEGRGRDEDWNEGRDEGRVAPLMNTRLFSISSFRNGNIATVIIGLGEFGIIAVLPLWLQFTLGYSSLQAGTALLPLAVGSFLTSGVTFRLAGKLSAVALVRIGLALETVGLAALGVVAATTSAPWWSIAIPLLVYGAGVGFATAQVTNVVLAEVPDSAAGQGSGIQSTFRQVGSALGIAVLTTVFFSTLSHQVRSALTGAHLPAEEVDRHAAAVTDSAGAAIAPLAADPATEKVAHAAREAMATGVALSSWIAAGLLIVGVVTTLLIPARRRGP